MISKSGTEDAFNKARSIDLYINYVCGLRCNHCFVGEHLNSNLEMPIELARSILGQAKSRGINSITLLGGEPTLYSKLIELVNYLSEGNFEFRIVTNGQKSFQKFIPKLSKEVQKKIHVCFSIDGSNEHIHDQIRGKGTFSNLSQSIYFAQSNNISFSGITSISKDNFDDVFSIIVECNKFKMDHLNIHYVTDRGFAKRNKIVAIDDWQKLCANIETMETDIMVRLEKTFVPLNVNVKCAVNSKNNLIVDPKGNIYGCTMFMNFNNMQSGTWLKDGIRMNEDLSNENHICSSVKNGCPALPLFNQELSENAKMNNLKVDCIFNKTNILNV